MTKLVFLLEEPSAREMLKGLLPRILPEEISWLPIVFKGKQDMEKQLVRKIQGWLEPDTFFIVLRDQDNADCLLVKTQLQMLCNIAGRPNCLVRIACRELENWYLGDLAAVEKAFTIPRLADKQAKKKFRDPDRLANADSVLSSLTRGKYQKISGSRSIGPHLKLNGNVSHSFCVFLSGLEDLIRSIRSEAGCNNEPHHHPY